MRAQHQGKSSHRPSIFALVVLLAGCASAAQHQPAAISAQIEAIASHFQACVGQVHNSPEMAIIRAHIPSDPLEATLRQLSDQSFATRPEIDAILAAYPSLQACRKAELDELQDAMPSLIPVLASGFAKADDDTVALIERKMSWGERLRRGRNLMLAVQAELQSEGRSIAAGLEQEREKNFSRAVEVVKIFTAF